MTITTVPNPVSATALANSFNLHDTGEKTQVTYMPRRGGPIVAGTAPNGPSLDYNGPEGNFNFRDNQITTDTTAIGSLVTVTLNVVPGLRTLTFSMLVPEVRNKTAASQPFETLAIKASRHVPLLGEPAAGANPTYQEMEMAGTAKTVELAD